MTTPGERVVSPLEELDDRALLDAFLAGSHDAFAVLFRRHRDRLWAVALRTCGNPADAEDALQEALLAAYRRAGSFRGDAAVTTWLHRIVVNACLDRLRRNKVRAADALPDDLDAHDTVLAAPAEDPLASTLLAERRAAVVAALAALPPEQRVALVLVDMEGYPVEEVAKMLDCPSGTVKSRCARGRARLARDPVLTSLRGTPGSPGASDPQVTPPPVPEPPRGGTPL